MTNDKTGHNHQKPGRSTEDYGKDAGDPAANIATYDFDQLSQGHHYILIRLAGETYTLRKTQSGKLILNK